MLKLKFLQLITEPKKKKIPFTCLHWWSREASGHEPTIFLPTVEKAPSLVVYIMAYILLRSPLHTQRLMNFSLDRLYIAIKSSKNIPVQQLKGKH